MQQLVDKNHIFDALQYLVDHNPLYKDSEINTNFLQSCKVQDPEGYDFFLNTDHPGQLDSSDDELFMNIDETKYGKNTDDEINSEDYESDQDNDIDRQDTEYW